MEIPEVESLSKHTEAYEIVFVGKMSYEPNVLAVTYFANHVFLELKQQYPLLKFTIVGANPDIRVQRLTSIEGVYVTGFVDTIVPYFQKATIVVAPMLTGAGIQNKIIQAMSYGCCVATTSIGAEGLSIKNNEIAIYDSDKEWTQGMKTLIDNRGLRIKMGHLSHEYVVSHLSKEMIGERFWQFIDYIDNNC